MSWISLSSSPSTPYGWSHAYSNGVLGETETSHEEWVRQVVEKEFDWNLPRSKEQLEKDVAAYKAWVRVISYAVSTGNYFDERLHKFDSWKKEPEKVEVKKCWWCRLKEWVHGLGKR